MAIMNFDWKKISLLIVDDDADLRETLHDIFNQLGVKEIYTAIDGEEALQSVESKKVNLIISDLQMPVMNGADLLKKLNERKYRIPFLFITGQSQFTEAKAAELGAVGLIYKPYTLNSLVEKTKNILLRSQSVTA